MILYYVVNNVMQCIFITKAHKLIYKINIKRYTYIHARVFTNVRKKAHVILINLIKPNINLERNNYKIIKLSNINYIKCRNYFNQR